MGEPATLLMLITAFLVPLGLWLFTRRIGTTRATVAGDGVQEATVVVRGRYRPATVVVERGIPVRLLFDRQEDQACSERVIFSDSQQERWLAPFATTVVQFIPTRSGEFLFTCAMGMYQGRLVVQEPRAGWIARHLRAPAPGLRSSGGR